MPLTGELEHLPIIDVIQLIYSTRKSGTLNVYSRKGEGQLVFNSGYIVGATHSNEKLRIGQILREGDIVTTEELEKALHIQENSGDNRKPLIATLFEQCGLSKESAFKALETLIEMTIVEMISWTKGIFSLEIDKIHISDEYRYLPTQLQELNLDTQMVLMDALRIFDEKVHAGEITLVDDEDESSDLSTDSLQETKEPEEELIVSEDMLGLADLDKIERKKPHVFKSLEVFDPAEIQRQIVSATLPDLDSDEQQHLANILAKIVTTADDDTAGSKSQAVIIYSDDQFIQHVVMTICQKVGLLFFSATETIQFNSLVSRALNQELEPVLLLDKNKEAIELLQELHSEVGDIFQIIEINSTATPPSPSFTEKLNKMQKIVLNKPFLTDDHQSFIDKVTSFTEQLQNCLHAFCIAERRIHFSNMRKALTQLQSLKKPADISLLVLQFIGDIFDRSLTLIVNKGELITERSIGILADKNQGVCAAQKLKIPLTDESILKTVTTSGQILLDSIRDNTVEEHLFREMGAPLESTLLLAPLTCRGRTITLTYADFGNEHSTYVPLDLITLFIEQAGQAMQKALFPISAQPNK